MLLATEWQKVHAVAVPWKRKLSWRPKWQTTGIAGLEIGAIFKSELAHDIRNNLYILNIKALQCRCFNNFLTTGFYS